MKKLILLRHAKSSWDNPSLDDHARPLNSRGQSDAPRIGNWLKSNGNIPDFSLASTSKRTRETLAALKLGTMSEVTHALYLASAQRMLSLARDLPKDAASAMILGHHPGIGELASRLVAAPLDHADFDRFPTGACLVLEFDVETWPQIGAGLGRVQAFIVPKSL